MGLWDKTKQAVKNADTKAGNAVDKEKLDSQIRDEERAIEKAIAAIGQAVVDALDAEKSIADVDASAKYDEIKASRAKIEECKKKKEEIDASYEAMKKEQEANSQ